MAAVNWLYHQFQWVQGLLASKGDQAQKWYIGIHVGKLPYTYIFLSIEDLIAPHCFFYVYFPLLFTLLPEVVSINIPKHTSVTLDHPVVTTVVIREDSVGMSASGNVNDTE